MLEKTKTTDEKKVCYESLTQTDKTQYEKMLHFSE